MRSQHGEAPVSRLRQWDEKSQNQISPGPGRRDEGVQRRSDLPERVGPELCPAAEKLGGLVGCLECGSPGMSWVPAPTQHDSSCTEITGTGPPSDQIMPTEALQTAWGGINHMLYHCLHLPANICPAWGHEISNSSKMSTRFSEALEMPVIPYSLPLRQP